MNFHRLGAPDYFGDRALLGSEIRSASIAALEAVCWAIGWSKNLQKTYGNLWKSPSFIDFMEKVGNIFKFLVRCALLIKWNREFVVIYGKFLLVQSPLFVAQTTQRCLEVFVGAEIDVGLLWISANHSTCSAGLWKVFRASQICRYSTDSTDSYSLL